MTTLLQLAASIHADQSASSTLARQFVAAWQTRHPDGRVLRRDLVSDAIPHLTADRFGAFVAGAAERTDAQQAVVDFSDRLIAELRAADVVVLGLPMYNFGVPSQLKAYFDHIARAGVTFRYTEQGPVGLLTGKRAVIFATRGGLFQGTPLDTQTHYVRDFLRFVGIEQVEFVYAEGLAYGDAQRAAGLERAAAQIAPLAA